MICFHEQDNNISAIYIILILELLCKMKKSKWKCHFYFFYGNLTQFNIVQILGHSLLLAYFNERLPGVEGFDAHPLSTGRGGGVERSVSPGASSCSWTRELFSSALMDKWLNKLHGQVFFRLTQLLTGYGCFDSYLHYINFVPSIVCSFWGVPGAV